MTHEARAAGELGVGDPLEMTSNVDAVWIDGVRQPLETRQTKLRDRYKDLTPNTLPEAYRR